MTENGREDVKWIAAMFSNHSQNELIPYITVKIFPCLKRMKVESSLSCLRDDQLSMVRPTDGPDSASGELEV